MTLDIMLSRFQKLWGWIASLDWTNPRVLVTTGLLCMLPFVAYAYVTMGLLIGAIMAVETLWLIEKLPNKAKILAHKHPLIADIVLTSFGAITLGGLFGTGLTLAMGAAFCAIILDLSLPFIRYEPEPEIQAEPAVEPHVATA